MVLLQQVSPRCADVASEAQVLDKDPPELGLAEDEGLGHRHRKKGESCAFAESLDHALALLGRAAVVRH